MTTKEIFVEKWKKLPWKKFEKNLFRLQHRIYKANLQNDINLVYKLQCLILGSSCSRYIAVRQISIFNIKNQVSKFDDINFLTFKQRFKLVDELKYFNNYTHQKLNRVYRYKSNGDQKVLLIPTLKDKAIQYLLMYALEPIYESIIFRESYGLKSGKSTWDIQTNICLNLQYTSNQYIKSILQLDIEKCFYKIDYKKLIKFIKLPKQIKPFLCSTLHGKIINEQNTNQIGIIFPLVYKIALYGIENIHNEQIIKTQINKQGLRYINNLIYFIKFNEDINLLQNKIDKFLVDQGLNFKETKMKLIQFNEGFDFLGWHFKIIAKHKKIISYPTFKSRSQLINKIKIIIKDTRYTLEQRLFTVKIIYSGWLNYNKYCNMKNINLWSLYSWTNNYVKRNSNISRKKRIKIMKLIFTGYKVKVNIRI